MDQLISAIEKALERKGVSAAAASREAAGNPAVIKNLKQRRGSKNAHPIDNLIKIARYLDLELYLGPPRRSTPEPQITVGDDLFVAVPRYDVAAAAGLGAIGDNPNIIGALAFRRDWLNQRGISTSSLCLIDIAGDSMEPTLFDGDLALIDRSSRQPKWPNIYAFHAPDDGLRVKRLKPREDGLLLVSDHKDHPSELIEPNLANRISIVGRVVSSNHTWS